MTSQLTADARIFVAGDRGLVGSAICRHLHEIGHDEILTAPRRDLDLRDQAAVNEWFASNRPEYVFLVAGKVGGILENSRHPAEFLYDNLMIHANVIEAARQVDVVKLLYLGSSCIYPREAPQPLTEESLLAGPLELTNEAYAIAKISGMKMCRYYRQQYGCDFISAMPTNLYGPNDNFDLETSHVLPALIRKFHAARTAGGPVEIWGTGRPRREFLHVDDLADACVHLMNSYSEDQFVNVGTGIDLTIRELAETVRAVVCPEADLVFDETRPDGTPRKVLDVSRLSNTGWAPKVDLASGIAATYEWFLDNIDSARGMR